MNPNLVDISTLTVRTLEALRPDLVAQLRQTRWKAANVTNKRNRLENRRIVESDRMQDAGLSEADAQEIAQFDEAVDAIMHDIWRSTRPTFQERGGPW